MKLIGIVGTNAEKSLNRQLLQFMQEHFADKAEIEILEIKDVPMFNETDDQTDSPIIQTFNTKISAADGVIIATPEHNHTIPSSLNSLIEWLSFNVHPLDGKPVMIVGNPIMFKVLHELNCICVKFWMHQASMRW